MIQWYETLFENYANNYENEPFTQVTIGECDFIEKEIKYNKSLRILDIGFGTARHAVELAKRGYKVTGIDLSESMLQKAKENAEKEQVKISFHKHDARNLPFNAEFDVALMLCEGSFPLMETDEMNYQILQNASKALKNTNSTFIFTTLNGLFPLFHSVKEFMDSHKNEGTTEYIVNNFNLLTFREKNSIIVTDDEGKKKQLDCNERYYVPSEVNWLLKSVGFTTIDIYGAKLGAFSRNHQLTTNDFEMLVIAQK